REARTSGSARGGGEAGQPARADAPRISLVHRIIAASAPVDLETNRPMPSDASPRGALLHALQDRLIPWARTSGMKGLFLAESPGELPPNLKVLTYRSLSAPERSRGRAYLVQQWWPGEGFYLLRFVQLA